MYKRYEFVETNNKTIQYFFSNKKNFIGTRKYNISKKYNSKCYNKLQKQPFRFLESQKVILLSVVVNIWTGFQYKEQNSENVDKLTMWLARYFNFQRN